MPAREEGGVWEDQFHIQPHRRVGGGREDRDPFLLCSHTEPKKGKGGRKEEGSITGKGRGGWSCVAVGPGRTQAGSSSGEDGTLPGPRPGHSIDIPDTGFPVMYG